MHLRDGDNWASRRILVVAIPQEAVGDLLNSFPEVGIFFNHLSSNVPICEDERWRVISFVEGDHSQQII